MTNSVNGKWLRLGLCVSATAIAATLLSGKLLAQAVERSDWSIELVDPKVLRVCADPHNMPFSTERGEGFENKLADASMAARAAPSRVSTTPQPINLLALPGAKKLSPNISARRCKKCRVRAWHLSASKTTRTSQTSGPVSSSSELTGRRNEARRAGKRRKSKRAAGRVGAAARTHVSVGLTGLLNPT